MKYKGFHGSISVSMEDNILYGKIECINDVVTFEAESPADLKLAFEDAVDDYLETCQMVGKEPEKPLSGTFNIRIGADLHKKAYLHAKNEGMSLNDFVKHSMEHALVEEHQVHMHLHMPLSEAAMSPVQRSLEFGSSRPNQINFMDVTESFSPILQFADLRKRDEKIFRITKNSEERVSH